MQAAFSAPIYINDRSGARRINRRTPKGA